MHPAIEIIPSPFLGTEVFGAIRKGGEAFFLDSALKHPRLGRLSFLGADPFLTFRSRGDRSTIKYRNGPTVFLTGNPFNNLKKLINKYRLSEKVGLPLSAGGAVGYFSYDMGRTLERLPNRTIDDLGLPECIVGFYDRGVIIDHTNNETYLFSTGLPFAGAEREAYRDERLKDLRLLLSPILKSKQTEEGLISPQGAYGHSLRSNITKETYLSAIEKSLDYIGRGDIYQVNFTQRFEAGLKVHPWDLYRRLRQLNPAPFAAYLEYPEVKVVSSSPERFIKQEGSLIETRPIKGTRPRGKNPEEDENMRNELWNSKKDRAELVMIVDLERNDLSRICQEGTVTVPELFALEEYATVYHLVSTITGKLPPGKDMVDVLKVSFPGGSITGAPKIRAMEIIEELEPVRRGIYTGSIGYIDFAGKSDTNIVIRTIVSIEDRVYLQVGGGIVADSQPEAEYQETLDKARALFGALGFQR